MLKISIITITYNSAQTIEATLQSLLMQDYKNVELIIIDGKSTDGTLSIVEKYRDHIAQVVSEKDDGLYFALNKGISLCTGDIIGILHSDDVYYNAQVLTNVAYAFTNNNTAEALYGDLLFVDRNNLSKIKRVWRSGAYKPDAFKWGWMPPHPTFFVKTQVYKKYGVFNTQLRYAADYELMLRFIHVRKIKIIYLPQIMVRMRLGGISNFSINNKLIANKEDHKAWQLNGIKPNVFTLLLKPLSKLNQYLLRHI